MSEQIRNQHFLGKTDDKKNPAVAERLGVELSKGVVLHLWNNLVVKHNRSCNKLREECHISQVIKDIVVWRRLPVTVDKIRNLLKREEAYTKRQ